MTMNRPPLVVYVDIDDTLIRTAGSKRIRVSGVLEHVVSLSAEGASLYCWSSGGGEYAREVAEELGIAQHFVAFLPKPHAMIDDQEVSQWRRLAQVLPGRCCHLSVEDYWNLIEESTPNR